MVRLVINGGQTLRTDYITKGKVIQLISSKLSKVIYLFFFVRLKIDGEIESQSRV